MVVWSGEDVRLQHDTVYDVILTKLLIQVLAMITILPSAVTLVESSLNTIPAYKRYLARRDADADAELPGERETLGEEPEEPKRSDGIDMHASQQL